MKRFIILTLTIFGFLLTYQTLRILSQQKYMMDINVNQFKGKTVKILAPDIFAEKNIIDTFNNRYKGTAKFNLVKDNGDFLNIDMSDVDIIIYPSFCYDIFHRDKKLLKIEKKLVPNLDKIMDNFNKLINERYSEKGETLAIPIAYIPYAIFFDPEKIPPATSSKNFFSTNRKIALPDNYEGVFTLSKFLRISSDKNIYIKIFEKISKENIIFYNLNDLETSLEIFKKNRPDLIIAPVYLKGFFERRAGTINMILPDEGTFGTLYLASIVNDREKSFTSVFMNHLLDPLIHKNLTNSFTIPITNKVSLNTIPAVLYNELRMNDLKYFDNIYILKDREDYQRALSLYKEFKDVF